MKTDDTEMSVTISAIRESNRLLSEQNALLMRIAENGTPQGELQAESQGLMTDRDLSLILMSDDILGAIDSWNRKCADRHKKRMGR